MSRNEFVCDCNVIHQDVVDNTTKNMPDADTFNKLAEFFKIIGDTTRTKILFALDQNEMCVCDIANVLGMSKSSISHQLGTLRRSGIVKCRKAGKEVFYMLDDDHVKEVFEIGVEHIKHKKQKLEGKNMKSKFKIKGLDCANCAAELERAIQKVDGIESASISFMTEKMELEYDETRKDEIMVNVKKVIKKEEPDVTIEEV